MKVLVTGGAGFIGSHSVEFLLRHRHDVVVFDDFSSGRQENLAAARGALICKGDVRDFHGLLQLVGREKIEAILHLAALTSDPLSVEQPREYHEVNLTGTVNVLEAARVAGLRRVVLASSSAVYGSCNSLPRSEEAVPQPLTPYGLQKRCGELYAALYYRLYGIETLCLRYFNVFGPRVDPANPYNGVISIFIDRMMNGGQTEIFGDGLQTRDFIYVEDVARANALALTQDLKDVVGKSLNVGTGKECSVLELHGLIAEELRPLKPVFSPSRVGDVRRDFADTRLFARVFGVETQYSLRQGLRFLIDSLRSCAS